VRRTLTVLADTARVRIVDGVTVLATHARSYDRGAQIEDPAHLQDLVDHKRGARQHRVTDVLIHAVPPIRDLLVAAAARGYNLGSITAALARIRQQCTVTELHAAVLEAIQRDVPHPNAVRLALDRRRDERGLPLVVTLPAHLQQRDVIVTPHPSIPMTGSPSSEPMTTPPMPDLRQRAHALRLPGLIAHWDEASHADWVPCLLSWEEDERARRSMERRLRCSGLGTFKPIADFDWHWPTRCDRPAIEELMSLQFMTEAANAIVVGPNGLGKSTIARNVAYQALIAGHTVHFAAQRLLTSLAAIDAPPSGSPASYYALSTCSASAVGWSLTRTAPPICCSS
jgi:hypothetical protein